MITTLAIDNYRSLLDLVLPLKRLNVITGPNGSGKSNLYRALRLLAETAQGGVVNGLAREGGLKSTFWAGPGAISPSMRRGDVPIEGERKKESIRLRLGFTDEDFGYAISLGLPHPSASAFALDPEIKRECIWAGPVCRPASLLIDRLGPLVKTRDQKSWRIVAKDISLFESIFTQVADPNNTPEALVMRELIRSWRFYDQFRTDSDAPARQPQLGTRTPVLHHDGRDLAAALQTIVEIGDSAALAGSISDAFPGASLEVAVRTDGRFAIELKQHGLLRPLAGAELSDGTLRYLLWVAALLTPRPPPLMVLNEPETSLYPDLLPALARLIIRASQHTQIWVISHAQALLEVLVKHPDCHEIKLIKELGQTAIVGRSSLDQPAWRWPD